MESEAEKMRRTWDTDADPMKEGIIMGAEKYTQKTLEALQTAQQTAALHYHQEITSIHLLLALVLQVQQIGFVIFTGLNPSLGSLT